MTVQARLERTLGEARVTRVHRDDTTFSPPSDTVLRRGPVGVRGDYHEVAESRVVQTKADARATDALPLAAGYALVVAAFGLVVLAITPKGDE